jgi:hypothetical protein
MARRALKLLVRHREFGKRILVFAVAAEEQKRAQSGT